MKICIERKKETINRGDLVYSKSVDKYGFVSYINEKYYFIDRDLFENWSNPYKDIDDLTMNLKLELVAKNKELVVHTHSINY